MTVRRFTQWCLALGLCLAANASAQTENGQWRAYSGDPGSTKYAPLDQINKTQRQDRCGLPGGARPSIRGSLALDPKLQVPNNFRVDAADDWTACSTARTASASSRRSTPARARRSGCRSLRRSAKGCAATARAASPTGAVARRRADLRAARRDADGAQREDRTAVRGLRRAAARVNLRFGPATRPAIAGPARRSVCRDVVIVGSSMSDSPPNKEGDARRRPRLRRADRASCAGHFT